MSGTAVFAPGSTALITGAASGIGFAIAKLCHDKGMKVILADLNADALKAARQAISSSSSDIMTSVLDVSNLPNWHALEASVMEKFGGIELLVLNAGQQIQGGWGDENYFRSTLETNLFGVIHGINTFLPVVQKAAESKPTSIIITGSKQGITNPPGNPAYNASKAAVKSLAEQLSYDLKGSKTSVHLLVPGWTFTGLTGAGTKEKPAGAWTPEQVVGYLHTKMDEQKFYVICPDNDVSEETDKKRMLWAAGDVIYERPSLTRWRDEWKEEAAETMGKTQI